MKDEFLNDELADLEEGTINSITGHPLGGLYQIHLDGGRMVHLDSGMGARQFADAYGSLGDAIGKKIRYKTDDLNVLSYFEKVDGDTDGTGNSASPGDDT